MTDRVAGLQGHPKVRAGTGEILVVLVVWSFVSVAFFLSPNTVGLVRLIPTFLAVVVAFSRNHGALKWMYLGVGTLYLLAIVFLTAIFGYSTDSVVIDP